MSTTGREHEYAVEVVWTGAGAGGTTGVRDYSRDHEVQVDGKPLLAGSADPIFRGDPGRHNPEELLVAALSQCHMLSYLFLCAEAGVVVTAYRDRASGTLRLDPDGGGRFAAAVLRPQVTVAAADMVQLATELHDRAEENCFIAASVDFPVHHLPAVSAG